MLWILKWQLQEKLLPTASTALREEVVIVSNGGSRTGLAYPMGNKQSSRTTTHKGSALQARLLPSHLLPQLDVPWSLPAVLQLEMLLDVPTAHVVEVPLQLIIL